MIHRPSRDYGLTVAFAPQTLIHHAYISYARSNVGWRIWKPQTILTDIGL